MQTLVTIQLGRKPARPRGIALLLVLLALVIGTVLALGFLANQSTSNGIADNLQKQARARQIAETGLALGAQRIKSSSNWRSTYSNGVWVSSASFGGGTFSLRADDGVYSAATGAVVGDGNLNNNSTDSVTLTAVGTYDGVSHTSRVVLVPPVATTGAYGAAVSTNIQMSNSARIDALNSSTSVYNPSSDSTGAATIATNSTTNGYVSMSNSATINGSMAVGVSGNVNNVINLNNQATITGTKSAQTTAATIASITTPSGLPASSGNASYSNSGSVTITAGTYHYNNFTVSNSYIVYISGNVVIYCDGSFSLSNSTEVRLNTGAKLTIYTSNFNLSNSAGMNMPSTGGAVPSNLTIYYTGSGTLSLSNSFTLAAQIYAPNGALQMSNSSRLFGSFQGRALQMSNSARFTQDLALNGGGSGSGSGGSSYTVTYCDQP